MSCMRHFDHANIALLKGTGHTNGGVQHVHVVSRCNMFLLTVRTYNPIVQLLLFDNKLL